MQALALIFVRLTHKGGFVDQDLSVSGEIKVQALEITGINEFILKNHFFQFPPIMVKDEFPDLL